ncbi:hypothetical protein HYV85_06295 [Candidatus Woesearchaeota archaeon]|nr:hypothetical protein [Candidatus Woesearchaeota archaeon]
MTGTTGTSACKLWIPSEQLIRFANLPSNTLVDIVDASVDGWHTAVLTKEGYLSRVVKSHVLVQIVGQLNNVYYDAFLVGYIKPNQHHSQYPKGLVLAAHISGIAELTVKDSGYNSRGEYFEERRSEAEQLEMIAKAQVPPFIGVATGTFQGFGKRAARRTELTPQAIDEFVAAAASTYASKALKQTERERNLIFYTASNAILEAGTRR